MKKVLIGILAIIAMTACSNEKKALVLYYSQTGTTKVVAEELQAQTGADICAFDVEEAYTGNFDETIQRCLKEKEDGFIPTLKTLDCDLTKYDVIYLGYPIWFGTYAPPVKALLKTADLSGKTIIPFASFGSGGLDSSSADLKAELTDSEIRNGYGVRTARVGSVAEEVNRFLIENGLKEGEIDPLPDYSEMAEVTEAEAGIFDQACSGYTFPLGTPVKVGSRQTPDGTDYVFTAVSTSPDGRSAESTIYVTAKEGKAPEFTVVVR